MPDERLRAVRRALLIAVPLLLCLALCAAGWWAAQTATTAPFVLAGATDVEIASHSLAALRITYHADGNPYAWRDQIWRQLVGQGWRAYDYTFGSTRQFAVTWYTREFRLGPLRIIESAVVGGDPFDTELVIVEFHRELHFRDDEQAGP